MIRFINTLIFKKILGWRIEGFIPEDKKIIAIVAPHTSWHDFFVGIFTRSVLKMENKVKFLGKEELFKIPFFGYILKKIGGFPVVRYKQTNSVDSVVDIFNRTGLSIKDAQQQARKEIEKKKKSTPMEKKELDEFLQHDFIPRFGGGIGVTRMISAMKKAELI